MEEPTPKHIRPKKLKQRTKQPKDNPTTTPPPTATATATTSTRVSLETTNNSTASGEQQRQDVVEETIQRMEAWMGVGASPSSSKTQQSKVKPSSSSPGTTCPSQSNPVVVLSPANDQSDGNLSNKSNTTTNINDSKKGGNHPKQSKSMASILKKSPKYSQPFVMETITTASTTVLQETDSNNSQRKQQPKQQPKQQDQPPPAPPVVCKPFVIERDPSLPFQRRQLGSSRFSKQQQDSKPSVDASSHAIEGYVPQSIPLYRNRPKQTNAMDPTKENPVPSKTITFETVQEHDNSNQEDTNGDNNKNETEDNGETQESSSSSSPLILSSLEELFQAAGEPLPKDRTTITKDTKLVEANISFSCMTNQEYQQQLEESKHEEEEFRQKHYKIFMGRNNIFSKKQEIDPFESDDQEDSEHENDNGDDDGDDDDDDDLLEILMECDTLDEEEDCIPQQDVEPRVFMKLWTALSKLLTPQAVDWLKRLENDYTIDTSVSNTLHWTPQVDRSDIGASRCAGFMAMLKLTIPSCLEELQSVLVVPQQQQQESSSSSLLSLPSLHRTAERRLGDFLRTFDYSMPMAKLQLNVWRVMTCILLNIVLVETRELPLTSLPPCAASVSMTLEEYRYLCRSAIQSFGKQASATN